MADKFIVEEVTGNENEMEGGITGDVVGEACFSRANVASVEEVVKSKNFILNFMDYIRSKQFFNSCERIAKEKKTTSKQVAKNFFEKVLGTISDVFHVAIDTLEGLIIGTLDILTRVLSAGTAIVCDVARRIVRVTTLNKTCVA